MSVAYKEVAEWEWEGRVVVNELQLSPAEVFC